MARQNKSDTADKVLKAKEQLEAAFDAITEGIAIVSPDGTVLRMNKPLAQLIGEDEKAAVGKDCCEIFPHHCSAGAKCPVKNFPNGTTGEFEIVFPEYRVYKETVKPIIRRGRLVGFVLVVKENTEAKLAKNRIRRLERNLELIQQDISRLREEKARLEDELDQAEKVVALVKLIGQIVPEVGRHARSVKESAKLTLSLAQNCKQQNQDMEKSLRELERHSTRLEKIAQFVSGLGLTGIDTLMVIPLKPLVNETVDEFADMFNEQLPRIEIDVPDDIELYGNRYQLKAVLHSIIMNSIESIIRYQGSTVRISARRTGSNVELKIEDDGPGIDQSILPRVFAPFFTTASDPEHVGLGLTICKVLIEAHKGKISISSSKERGTVVTIWLPAYEQ